MNRERTHFHRSAPLMLPVMATYVTKKELAANLLISNITQIKIDISKLPNAADIIE